MRRCSIRSLWLTCILSDKAIVVLYNKKSGHHSPTGYLIIIDEWATCAIFLMSKYSLCRSDKVLNAILSLGVDCFHPSDVTCINWHHRQQLSGKTQPSFQLKSIEDTPSISHWGRTENKLRNVSGRRIRFFSYIHIHITVCNEYDRIITSIFRIFTLWNTCIQNEPI